jgi:hypothetical protein
MAMTPEEAHRLTKVIMKRVDEHHNDETLQGGVQWYADEFVIDCDAEEFWKVVEEALESD